VSWKPLTRPQRHPVHNFFCSAKATAQELAGAVNAFANCARVRSQKRRDENSDAMETHIPSAFVHDAEVFKKKCARRKIFSSRLQHRAQPALNTGRGGGVYTQN
jgi:hypothetical protein